MYEKKSADSKAAAARRGHACRIAPAGASPYEIAAWAMMAFAIMFTLYQHLLAALLAGCLCIRWSTGSRGGCRI